MNESKQELALDPSLDLELEPEPISPGEINFSQELFDVLAGKKVVGARVLFKNKRELALFFDDGTKLFVDNFSNPNDIAISLPDTLNDCAKGCGCHD